MRTLKNFNRIWPAPTPYPTWFSSQMTNIPADSSLGCLPYNAYAWTYWFTNWNVIVTMNWEHGWNRPFWWYVLVYDTNGVLQDSWCVNIPQIQEYWTASFYRQNYQDVFTNWISSLITGSLWFSSIDSFINTLYLQNENTWTLNFYNSDPNYRFLDYNTWNQINSINVPKWTTWSLVEDHNPYIIYTLSDSSKFVLELLWWVDLSMAHYWASDFVSSISDERRLLANGQKFTCTTK